MIAVEDAAKRDILIARLSAFVIGFEEAKNCLKAYIEHDAETGDVCEKIIEENNGCFSKSIIQDRNWNAEWEAGFEPVTIEGFCSIRADFHPANEGVTHDIIINPKMSFGTGHHATTWLMVQGMSGIDLVNKSVLDFGTGTGVLAILAEKCGAGHITAIDNDEWSIRNAEENFNLNNCHNLLLIKADRISDENLYDVVLANINRNILLEQLGAIQQHLKKNGVVLLSGLLTGDEEIIVAEAARQKLRFVHKSEMSGWICLLMANG